VIKRGLLDLSTRNAQYYVKEKEQRQLSVKPDNRGDRILETAKQDLRMEKSHIILNVLITLISREQTLFRHVWFLKKPVPVRKNTGIIISDCYRP
jgi:hypothetical protein